MGDCLNGGRWTLVAELVEVGPGKHNDRLKLAEAATGGVPAMSEALRMVPEKITAHGFGWHYAPPFGRSPRSLRGLVSCGPATSPTRKAVFAVLGPLWPVQPPHLPNREACEKRHGCAPEARGRSARALLRACRQAFPSWPREAQDFGLPPRPAAFRRPLQRPLLWPASRGEPF